jgi:hypothetical protein
MKHTLSALILASHIFERISISDRSQEGDLMRKIVALVSRCILMLLPAAAPSVPIPVVFEENRGQADDPVRFLAHGPGYHLLLSSREAVLSLANPKEAASRLLRMRWLGGNAAPVLAGSGQQHGITNYLLGKDSRKWQTGIPHFAAVTHRGVYSGVDLTFHGADGHLEYDLVVAPGTDPSVIQLSFSGADTIRSDGAEGLIFRLRADAGRRALRAEARRASGIPGCQAQFSGGHL